MQLSDAGGQLVARPTPNPTLAPGWANNDLTESTPPTIADPDWMNAVSAEFKTILDAAGIAMSKTAVDQLYKALLVLHRQRLTAAANYYCDFASGSDSTGDGSSGNPWKTLQHSWDTLFATVDGAGQAITIHQVAGIDDGGLGAVEAIPGTTIINLVIAGGINTANAQAIIAEGNARLAISGTGTVQGANWDLVTDASGFIKFEQITLGGCAQAKVSAGGNSKIVPSGNYVDGAGNSASHFEVGSCASLFVFPSAQVTQNGAVYTQFAKVTENAEANLATLTFAGSASTGAQYTVNTGGGLFLNGVTLPGSAGTADATTFGWVKP